MFKRDVSKCWTKKGNILIGVLFKRDVFKCCCKKGNTLIDLLCKRNVFICCCRKGNILIVLCLKGIYWNVVAKKEMCWLIFCLKEMYLKVDRLYVHNIIFNIQKLTEKVIWSALDWRGAICFLLSCLLVPVVVITDIVVSNIENRRGNSLDQTKTKKISKWSSLLY